MKFMKEFKEFIMRWNVLDIIATAFGKITTSLVNDVFMPFISWIFGARDMTALNVIVRPAEVDAAGEVVKEAITIGFGTFVMAIIDFILVALVVFGVVKAFNAMRKKQEAEEEAAPADPEPTKEEVLLEEIRDLLKQDKQ